jgi:hypothetical protein
LLGGQAARAEVSCSSCHRNGRGNPDFAFVGVSGDPGTADITSSFFSSHRGDGVDNPVLIPDLAGPRESLKVDRSLESGALQTFIRGLIVDEFDGPEPSAAALDALAAYVRGLTPDACPVEAMRSIRVADRIADVEAAVTLVVDAEAGGDRETSRPLVAAARTELRRIYSRYHDDELENLRRGLLSLGTTLGLAEISLRDGEAGRSTDAAPTADELLTAWRADWEDLAAELEAQESASLFNPDVLSRTLAEQR